MQTKSKKYTGQGTRKQRRAMYAEERKRQRKLKKALRKQFGLAKQRAHYNMCFGSLKPLPIEQE